MSIKGTHIFNMEGIKPKYWKGSQSQEWADKALAAYIKISQRGNKRNDQKNSQGHNANTSSC